MIAESEGDLWLVNRLLNKGAEINKDYEASGGDQWQ